MVNFIECMDFDRVFWVGHTVKSNNLSSTDWAIACSRRIFSRISMT